MTYGYTATYSPDDNKLRLYAATRLDEPTYQRAKVAGFRWAPKQELFYAVWSPAAEDLLLELAEEIGDEDSSLLDRASERAERFEGYSESRAKDAESARKAVSAIADNIPLGQPILVGHHSEKHARRDAARIENGMRKAVENWKQSAYWTDRADAALRHAKYLERPDVRARRIKKLESELRKVAKNRAEAARYALWWAKPGLDYERARALSGCDALYLSFPLADFPRDPPASQYEGAMSLWSALEGIVTPEQAQGIAIRVHESYIKVASRWVEHYEHRLAYERAMQGTGALAEQFTGGGGLEKGGACKCWAGPRGGWATIQKVNKVSVTVLDNWGNGGANFTRTVPFDKLSALMTAAEVEAARAAGRLTPDAAGTGFYLAEAKAPAEPVETFIAEHPEIAAANAASFKAMEEQLREGVKVVVAPQLFPTPPELAAKVIEAADIKPGHLVLEPSAGTGALLEALGERPAGTVLAVEINRELATEVERRFPYAQVSPCDFLAMSPSGCAHFDRIVMNPPFENLGDLKHVKHALRFLSPGGRLVAIMAARPSAAERVLAHSNGCQVEVEALPEDSFKASGTGVRTILVTIDRPAAPVESADTLRRIREHELAS